MFLKTFCREGTLYTLLFGKHREHAELTANFWFRMIPLQCNCQSLLVYNAVLGLTAMLMMSKTRNHNAKHWLSLDHPSRFHVYWVTQLKQFAHHTTTGTDTLYVNKQLKALQSSEWAYSLAATISSASQHFISISIWILPVYQPFTQLHARPDTTLSTHEHFHTISFSLRS